MKILTRLKERWNFKADPYDEEMFLSKEWFEGLLYAFLFFIVIPCIAVFICRMLGNPDAIEIVCFALIGGLIFSLIVYEHTK